MKLPSYSFLVPAALLLGLAPFVPEPHLTEKVRMLFTGQLSKPIDIFDLFLHGTLPALLIVKGFADLAGKLGGASTGTAGQSEETSDLEAPRTRAQKRREERERRKG